MKKLVVLLVLMMFSLFSMVACNSGISSNKSVRDAETYRREYVSHLSRDPMALALFLSTTGELDEFVDTETDDNSIIDDAAKIFSQDENIRGEALKRARDIVYEAYTDRDWENGQTLILPPTKIAGTGEPISSKPAGPWLPPEDFLTEEEKEFREQVIETAGLDRNSPDFEEQLARIYAATGSLDYPNYETYKLFVDRLATINKNK